KLILGDGSVEELTELTVPRKLLVAHSARHVQGGQLALLALIKVRAAHNDLLQRDAYVDIVFKGVLDVSYQVGIGKHLAPRYHRQGNTISFQRIGSEVRLMHDFR